MKDIKYRPWTTKYSVLFPLFIILSGIALYFYRINSGASNGLSAFIEIKFWLISPLILIFGGIIFFFIILGTQGWENKMNKLSKDEKQQELRNKVIKDFKYQEKKEKRHMRFYIIVGIILLTTYVLIASNSKDGSGVKDAITFGILGILILITQAIRLWKFTKYSKLQKLKIYGKSIQGKILEITKKGKGFLRDDTIKYQILATSDETGEIYKSLKTRFDIPFYLKKGDKILIYIDVHNPKIYFIDIESAFGFKEEK